MFILIQAKTWRYPSHSRTPSLVSDSKIIIIYQTGFSCRIVECSFKQGIDRLTFQVSQRVRICKTAAGISSLVAPALSRAQPGIEWFQDSDEKKKQGQSQCSYKMLRVLCSSVYHVYLTCFRSCISNPCLGCNAVSSAPCWNAAAVMAQISADAFCGNIQELHEVVRSCN